MTSGNNDFTDSGYDGSLYPAGAGFDEASGLGSPRLAYRSASGATSLFVPGPRRAPLLPAANRHARRRPSRASPRSRRERPPTLVTIMGSGFLAIDGAVRVALDGRTAIADVHVVDPLHRDVSPGVAHDRGAPRRGPDVRRERGDARATRSRSSPPRRSGRCRRVSAGAGATRVTHPRQRFHGRVDRPLRHRGRDARRVVSSTELVVTAPKGTGSVHVTVTATGGVSAP